MLKGRGEESFFSQDRVVLAGSVSDSAYSAKSRRPTPKACSNYFSFGCFAPSAASSSAKSAAVTQRIEVLVRFHLGDIVVAGGDGLLEPDHRSVGLILGEPGGAVPGAFACSSTAAVTARQTAARYKLSASVRRCFSQSSAVVRHPPRPLLFESTEVGVGDFREVL